MMTKERDMTTKEQAAQRSGGSCPLCGWREGDGVQVCYYDADLGSVGHQNTAPAGLTPEQQALYDLYESPGSGQLVYLDEQSREQRISEVLVERRRSHERHVEYAHRFGTAVPQDKDLEEWSERYAAGQRTKPVLADLLAQRAEICVEPGLRYMAHVYPKHKCGGRARLIGPYHIGCTGCDSEIKLWEHGIDYDVG